MSELLKWTTDDGEPWALAVWGHVPKTTIKASDVRMYLRDLDAAVSTKWRIVEHLYVRELAADEDGHWCDPTYDWCDEANVGAKPVTAVRFT